MSSDGRGDSISSLTAAASVDGTELIPLTQNTRTKRTTLQIIADWIVQTALSFTQSGSGATARNAQAKMRDFVSVTDFGAVGDGSTDDTTAFENAIAALPSVGGTLYLPNPSVSYRITSTLTIAAKSRLKVVGAAPSGGLKGCQIEWDGADSGTALILDRVRNSIFEDFSIVPGSGTLSIGVRVDHVSAPSGSTLSTANHFRRIGIGASTTGFQFGNSSTANNDLHTLDDCTVDGAGTYGVYIHQSQIKRIRILGGSIASRTYGIYCNAGSFHSFGTNFSGNTTDVFLGTQTDTIQIDSAQSEGAEKFLDDSGQSNNAWPVTIISGRMAINGLGSDNIYMRFRKGGTLTLIGNKFGSGTYDADARWSFSSAAPGCTVVSFGNQFPNETPFTIASTQNIYSVGDKGIESGGEDTELCQDGIWNQWNLKFPASHDPSTNANTLDDYEEGTWTPTDTSGAGLSLTTGTCQYVKVGQMVTVSGNITYPSTVNGSAAQIGSLPFTSQNITSSYGGYPSYSNVGSAFSLVVVGNSTNIQVYDTSGAAITNATLSTKIVRFTITYRASA